MKTIALFCLFFAAAMFSCAHQTAPETSEPKPIFEEEESDEGYTMLEDEDVGITAVKEIHCTTEDPNDPNSPIKCPPIPCCDKEEAESESCP